MTQRTYIFQTSNFSTNWTWIKRLFFLILALILIMVWDLENYSMLIKLFSFCFATILFFAIPVSELCIDESHLYYIRISNFKFLCRETKYTITDIASIRCAGLYTKTNDIIDAIVPGFIGVRANTIEMTFKDNSSTSMDLLVYKNDIKTIIKLIYEMKEKQRERIG